MACGETRGVEVNPGIWNDVPLEELVQRNLPKEDQTADSELK